MLIGVIGGDEAEGEALRLAYEVGREVASRGHTLVSGGRGGVMRESCRGAKEAGGLTVGILPGDDLADANEFIDIPVITGIGYARNTIVARTANALVAVDGSYGTLSEIAFGLNVGRPIIGLATWELRDGSGNQPPIERVATAVEAVDACERAVPA
ncbi:MAG: TIGR00725 family protein [Dehalococcoidia bacterium]|nr:TIGR00725 family protein [Dehalococcoidia bacterium]